MDTWAAFTVWLVLERDFNLEKEFYFRERGKNIPLVASMPIEINGRYTQTSLSLYAICSFDI